MVRDLDLLPPGCHFPDIKWLQKAMAPSVGGRMSTEAFVRLGNGAGEKG